MAEQKVERVTQVIRTGGVHVSESVKTEQVKSLAEKSKPVAPESKDANNS